MASSVLIFSNWYCTTNVQHNLSYGPGFVQAAALFAWTESSPGAPASGNVKISQWTNKQLFFHLSKVESRTKSLVCFTSRSRLGITPSFVLLNPCESNTTRFVTRQRADNRNRKLVLPTPTDDAGLQNTSFSLPCPPARDDLV